MTKAVGIIGSDAAAKRIYGRLRSLKAEIKKQNYQFIDQIHTCLEADPGIETVLLCERGLRENNPNYMEAMETLRNAYPNIRIVFIMDNPERNYDFEVWCYERRIFDIFYPDHHTNIDPDAIGAAAAMGYLDPDYRPPPPNPNALLPEPENKPGLLDRFKMPEIKMPTLPELKPRQAKSSSPPQRALDAMSRCIGVINCSRGFGATTLTVGMAQCLLHAGYSVAVMAMDLKDDLRLSGLEDLGVTVSIPSADEMDNPEELAAAHDFLIIDFGIIYDFLPSGKPITTAQRADEARAVLEAYSFCDMRLHLISDEPWHKNKSKLFEGDPEIKIIKTHEADASAILREIGAI